MNPPIRGMGPQAQPTRSLGWVFLPLLLFVVGCAGATTSNPFERSGPGTTVALRVQNDNIYEVAVYALPSGRRQLLGRVTPRTVQFFEFQWPGPNPLSLEVEMMAGERYRLPPFPFTRGVGVRLYVAPRLQDSFLRQ